MTDKEMVVYKTETPFLKGTLTKLGLISASMTVPVFSIAAASSGSWEITPLAISSLAVIALPILTFVKRVRFKKILMQKMIHDQLSYYRKDQWLTDPYMKNQYIENFLSDYDQFNMPWYQKIVSNEIILKRKGDIIDENGNVKSQIVRVNSNRAVIVEHQESSELSIWKDAIANAYTLDPTLDFEEIKKDIAIERKMVEDRERYNEDLERYNEGLQLYRTQITQQQELNQMINEAKRLRLIEKRNADYEMRAERDYYVAQQLKAKNDLVNQRDQEVNQLSAKNQMLEARIQKLISDSEATYDIILNREKREKAKLVQEEALREEERKISELYDMKKKELNLPNRVHYEEPSDYEYCDWEDDLDLF